MFSTPHGVKRVRMFKKKIFVYVFKGGGDQLLYGLWHFKRWLSKIRIRWIFVLRELLVYFLFKIFFVEPKTGKKKPPRGSVCILSNRNKTMFITCGVTMCLLSVKTPLCENPSKHWNKNNWGFHRSGYLKSELYCSRIER